eukprot:1160445-Pelagomonas_calceolata.AAC.15
MIPGSGQLLQRQKEVTACCLYMPLTVQVFLLGMRQDMVHSVHSKHPTQVSPERGTAVGVWKKVAMRNKVADRH